MKRRLQSRHAQGDAGVYAILYAALVVVLVAISAVVVDTAQVRQNRRLDRSATDSAALAGAAFLNPAKAGGSPQGACLVAWQYISTTLQIPVPGNACAQFARYSLSACPTMLVADDQTVGDLSIRVAWPIPRAADGGFLTPDIAPAAPGSVTQPFASGTDDTTARGDGSDGGCERLGIAITQNTKFRLAPAFGVNSTSTQVHSVARYVFLPGKDEYNYPLVVLDQHACNALGTNGSGTNVLVQNATTASPPNPNLPGRIAIDSDGTGDSMGSCSGGQTILNVAGSGSFIQAEDGVDHLSNPSDTNSIEIYSAHGALPGNASNLATNTCTPSVTMTISTPCVSNLVPRTERVTRAPFDQRFQAGVNQLANTSTGFGSVTTSQCATKKCGGTWSITGNATGLPWYLITGKACSLPFSGTSILGDHYFVNCPAEGAWTLGNVWTFPTGSSVIVNGDLKLGAGGCFVTNYDSSWSPLSPCFDVKSNPLPFRPVDSLLGSNGILSVRGNVLASGGGDLVLPGTFLNQPTADSYFDGTSLNDVYWTAPYGNKAIMDAACRAGGTSAPPPVDCFRNLAYWTDSTAQGKFAGGSSFTFEGTYFLGNAPLVVGGNGAGTVAQSQFVALTVTASGGKTLTFTPNPNRTTGIPRSGTALIR